MGTTQNGALVEDRPAAVDARERELVEARRDYFRGKGSLEEVKRLEREFPIPGSLRLEKQTVVGKE